MSVYPHSVAYTLLYLKKGEPTLQQYRACDGISSKWSYVSLHQLDIMTQPSLSCPLYILAIPIFLIFVHDCSLGLRGASDLDPCVYVFVSSLVRPAKICMHAYLLVYVYVCCKHCLVFPTSHPYCIHIQESQNL